MRVLSGIQPSGELQHRKLLWHDETMIEYQKTSDFTVFIVNFHAMTSVSDGPKTGVGTIQVALDFLPWAWTPINLFSGFNPMCLK